MTESIFITILADFKIICESVINKNSIPNLPNIYEKSQKHRAREKISGFLGTLILVTFQRIVGSVSACMVTRQT